MTTNLRGVRYTPHTFPHVGPVRPSVTCSKTQNDPSWTEPSGASLGQTSLSTVGTTSGATTSGVECGLCHEVRTPATWCMDSEIGEYAVCSPCNTPHARTVYRGREVCTCGDFNCASLDVHVPRRMVAVTVALSEPMSSEPLDWPATIASLMRLTYANTTVEVIDTWRVDE